MARTISSCVPFDSTEAESVTACLQHSCNNTLTLRQHLKTIASLLNEAREPEVQRDVASLKAVVMSMNTNLEAAHEMVNRGKKTFEDLSKQLEDLAKHCQKMADDAKTKQGQSGDNLKYYENIAELAQCLCLASKWAAVIGTTVGAGSVFS